MKIYSQLTLLTAVLLQSGCSSDRQTWICQTALSSWIQSETRPVVFSVSIVDGKIKLGGFKNTDEISIDQGCLDFENKNFNSCQEENDIYILNIYNENLHFFELDVSTGIFTYFNGYQRVNGQGLCSLQE